MSEDPPMFKVKSSLLPSLNIDSSLLGYRSPANNDLFSYELDLLTRYLERKEHLLALKNLEKQKVIEQDLNKRKSVGEEFQKMVRQTQLKIEERELKVQNSGQNQEKINQLRVLCPGIKDANEAHFYLEAQNYDVQKAAGFYTSCTGRSNVARINQISLKFIMPEKNEFVYSFDSTSLMWSMLEQIHLHLSKKRSFKVKIKSTGKEIKFEDMTKKTFANYGLVNNAVLVVVYD